MHAALGTKQLAHLPQNFGIALSPAVVIPRIPKTALSECAALGGMEASKCLTGFCRARPWFRVCNVTHLAKVVRQPSPLRSRGTK